MELGGREPVSDVPDFDPTRTWVAVEARLDAEQDPAVKALLTQVRDHMKSEIEGDFDALMETLIDEPRYHFWGTPEEGGPKGREAVASFYRNMIDSGGNRFHFEVERVFADATGVVTEGRMRQPMSGAIVATSGVTEVDGEPVDSAATYLSEWQILTVWPAGVDGRLVGEDIYFGSPPMADLKRLP
jgi:limonene-1,2-epoxide hydrolase